MEQSAREFIDVRMNVWLRHLEFRCSAIMKSDWLGHWIDIVLLHMREGDGEGGEVK